MAVGRAPDAAVSRIMLAGLNPRGNHFNKEIRSKHIEFKAF